MEEKLANLLVSQGGVVLMFVICLVTGYRQVWVWGREKAELVKANEAVTADRNLWRDRCLTDVDGMKAELKAERAALAQLRAAIAAGTIRPEVS